MTELPPPIGANRVDDPGEDDASGALDRFSARTRLAAAAVVAGLAIAAGVIGYRVIADDDGDSAAEGGDVGRWDAIAVRDPESGTITIVDANGEELDTFESTPGIGPFDTSGPYVLSVVDDEGELVDSRDGQTTSFEVPDDARATFIARPTGMVAVAGPLGNIVLVDPEGGDPIDVGELSGLADPRLNVLRARLAVDERRMAVVDETNFQTIVIDLDGDTDAVFLPGQLLALGHGTVLTAQVAGDRAEVRFSGLDGSERATVEVETPVNAHLTAAGTAIVASRSGSLLRVTDGGADPSELATLDVAEDGAFQALVLASTERIVYPSAEGEVVAVDLAGEEVLREAGELLPMQGAALDRARCVVVGEGGGDAELGDSVPARLIDTSSGEQVGDDLAAAAGGALVGAGDGCAVAVIGPGVDPSVTSAEGDVQLDPGSTAVVAPDGTSYVERSGDTLTLRSVASPDDDPVELPAGDQAGFVDR